MSKELTASDFINVNETSNYVYHIKSHIEFDEKNYDEHVESLKYFDLGMDYVIACQELALHRKRYKAITNHQKAARYRWAKIKARQNENMD